MPPNASSILHRECLAGSQNRFTPKASSGILGTGHRAPGMDPPLLLLPLQAATAKQRRLERSKRRGPLRRLERPFLLVGPNSALLRRPPAKVGNANGLKFACFK